MDFQIAGINILMLVAMSIPGYVLVKTKAVKPEVLPSFAKVLLYVCQPCLSLYSLQQAVYSQQMLINLLIVFGLSLGLMLLVILVGYLIFLKNYKDAKSRICILAGSCGNVGFFGVPVLAALLPNHPEALAYSAVFAVTMNLVGWTVGMFVLSGDKSYIKVKKIFLNPTIIIMAVAIPLFLTGTKLPTVLMDGVNFFAKTATVLAMLMLGMRFGSANLKTLFSGYRQYVAIFMKLAIFPLITFLVLMPIDVDPVLKTALFILSAMPPAALNLNFAELAGVAPETASSIVLVGSILCIVTLPLLMLLI